MKYLFWFKTTLIFFSLLAWGFATQAQQGRIGKIEIKGNKKIEAEAIRNKLVSREGQVFDREQIREDVVELFSTGYFYNVVVEQSGAGDNLILTYTVEEKPSIVEILYQGNDEIDDEELGEASGLAIYEFVDNSKIREAIEKIEKLYEEKGFFLARVNHRIEPVDNGVRLIIEVTENDMVKVKNVRFLGNENIPDGRLKSVMVTQEGGFFSFISGSGAYKQDAFERDVQVLSYLYFNEGYVQAKVDRPQVYVTPDKKGIYITIRIEEGQQFNVGAVDFTGDLLFSRDELLEETQIEEGDLFVYETLQADLRTLQAKYGDLGYAFANIIPRTKIREKDRLVDITFEIDKGEKVYIGEINVKGNSKTRDKVVRRELRIVEGELYNETRKRESVANVKRLGFFEEVNFNTSTPKDRTNVMNIDIVVKERNTGTIQVGAGYSSFQGFVFNGQVNQTNLMGRGQKLGVSIDFSDKNQLFKVSFTEPYFMDTEWSLGFDAYQSQRQLIEYREIKKGGAIRVGHPLAKYLYGFVRYKLDETELELRENGDEDLFPIETASGVTSSVTLSLEYDKRDDRFAPTKGIYSSASVEYAGLGGDLKYTKGFGTFRYFKNIIWDLVWRNNLTYGIITSEDPSQEPPFNELFLLGGANSLRGYDWFTIGRRKRSQKAYEEAVAAGDPNPEATALKPFGGTQQFFYQLELEFPLIAEAGVKGVMFYDIGNADNSLMFDEFRSDVGFGFRWFSPIGPLRFEWGFPIDRKKEFNEDTVNFQFAIGNPF